MRWSKQSLILLAGTGTILLFAVLMVWVFGLSSESGSNFGAYSTYRSDPVGMMAVYNALDRIDGYEVERYIKGYENLPLGAGATLVIAGAGINPDPVPVLDAVEGFAATGGRVVIAFFPLHEDSSLRALDDFIEDRDHRDFKKKGSDDVESGESTPGGGTSVPGPADVPTTAPEPNADDGKEPATSTAQSEEDETPGGDEKQAPEDAMEFGPPLQDISERWEFQYGFEKPGGPTHHALLDRSLAVEPMFSGHSGLYFTPITSDRWKIVYGTATSDASSARAVVMERKIGSGSVVLCSDAFFLSNEALQKHYDPQLLSWIFGEQKRILFSEVHLGTQQQDRIMTLVRRYRLHGMVFGLVLVTLLFVWRHGATLVPRQEFVSKKGPATGAERSHQEGLDNLLARFIPQDQLLGTCVREWSQHFHNDPKGAAVQRLVSARRTAARGAAVEAELVAAFNEIAREIHHK